MKTKKYLLSCVAIASVMGLCGQAFASAAPTISVKKILVTAHIKPACTFNIDKNVEFGDIVKGLDAFGEGAISVDCIAGQSYSVALGGGVAFLADASASPVSTRYMVADDGAHTADEGHLTYELYSDAEHTLANIWGDGGTQYVPGKVVERESQGGVKVHTVYGKIASGDIKATLLSGDYKDTVDATLSFTVS